MARMIALLIFFFSFIGSLDASNLQEGECLNHSCVAVVDAGSTASRLHVYAFDHNEMQQSINIHEVWSKKITPGSATLEPKQATIDRYLDRLFEGFPEKNIPIYFYATAGMRLLPEARQFLFYKVLNNWFLTHPEWTLKEAKTITGNEEGVLGWLAVNYQNNSFNGESKSNVGVMDMGGASVQIAFPIKSATNLDKNDLVEIDVYGRHYKIFVHSFLGIGQMLLSYQFLNAENCFANDYPLPNGAIAQGDAISCQSDVSKLINVVHKVSDTIQPVLAQNAVDSWHVMGGVSSLVDHPPFHFENEEFTSERLLEQGNNETCSRSWQDLISQFPQDNYIYGSCLFSAYYYALIVNGYGLSPQTTIHFTKESKKSDWTLGVMLRQS